MPISLECTSCAKQLKVADTLAGRSIKCPKCSTVIKVAAADAAPAVRPSAPQPAKALATTAKKPKQVEDEDEDLEEDEDLNDPNIKASPSVRAAKKTRRDEEEDEDEDEDDPNVRSVAGARKKSRRDEEDEDEDEEPRGKSDRKKGKDSRRDEEDEEEDDDNVKSTAKMGKDEKDRSASRARRLMARCDISDEHYDQARGELGRGERLVWVGQPVPKIMVIRSLAAAIGAGIVGAIFLIVGLVIALSDKNTPGMIWIFPVVGLFIMIGGISCPFLAKMRAGKTLYAITNRRAIVWNCNVVGVVSITNYTPEQLQNMWRRNSWFMTDQGGGDLIFKTVTVITTTHHYNRRGGYSGSSTSTTTYYYGFLAILYAPEVESVLRETLITPFKRKRRRDEDDD